MPAVIPPSQCVARALRELGRIEEALAIQRELKAAHDVAGSQDQYVDEEIAACEAALTARVAR